MLATTSTRDVAEPLVDWLHRRNRSETSFLPNLAAAERDERQQVRGVKPEWDRLVPLLHRGTL